MIRSRNKPDGLPFRVYENHGRFTYSIGYKAKTGKWVFKFYCPAGDVAQIKALRRKAVEESLKVTDDQVHGGFTQLVDAWFKWQEALPADDTRKRAASTLKENQNEAKQLKKYWGHLDVTDLTRTHAYEYLDDCLNAVDKEGKPRPRGAKGNKEIALARLILEYGIRKGLLATNPFDRITKNKTVKDRRYITDEDLALAVEVGREIGGPQHICAMALKTAFLCVRRSFEVRKVMRDSIREEGILWRDAKNKDKPAVLIEWSPELRSTITEALSIKRNKVAGTMYIFGNMRGQPYTKGGWKATLDDLMVACEKKATERQIEFQRFNLQQCRPKGVSDKLERGDEDTQDATLHTDGKMISQVYDRRQIKKATPAG